MTLLLCIIWILGWAAVLYWAFAPQPLRPRDDDQYQLDLTWWKR